MAFKLEVSYHPLTMQESSLARRDSLHESNHNCVRKGKNLSMKLNLFNTVNNEEYRRGQWSVVSGLAQAWTALLASPPCAQYNVFLVATLFV